jgi:hypothetical protein
MSKTKKKRPPCDVRVMYTDCALLFEPLTDHAHMWLDEHATIESWQWLGSSFAVEHSYAPDLVLGMRADGLEVHGS